MASDHILYNKQKLCYTDLADFTNFQGVGSDPLYKRYNSVFAIVKSCVPSQYHSFLAQPIYNEQLDVLDWYSDKWKDVPVCLSDLHGSARTKYEKIKEVTIKIYFDSIVNLDSHDMFVIGGALKFISDEKIYCYDNKVVMVAWGMQLDKVRHNDFGSVVKGVPHKNTFAVTFEAGEHGSIADLNCNAHLEEGCSISPSFFPIVTPDEGYIFSGWNPPQGNYTINKDLHFTATYETQMMPKEEVKPKCSVSFDAGEYGSLTGNSSFLVDEGTMIPEKMIPSVISKKNYTFTGWNHDPSCCRVDSDHVFIAKYDKKRCCKRWWLWLLALLLLFLLFLLFLLGFRTCRQTHPHLSHGDVELTLNWENTNDLDLICVDPNGEEISFRNKKSSSGGILDVDMNVEEPRTSRPVEHIYWPHNSAPKGTYHVYLYYYENYDEEKSTSYVVKVKYSESSKKYEGTIHSEKDLLEIISFTIE